MSKQNYQSKFYDANLCSSHKGWDDMERLFKEADKELEAAKIDYGLLQIDHDNKESLLKSCENALAERDIKLETKDECITELYNLGQKASERADDNERELEAKNRLISKFIKAFGHYYIDNGFDSCSTCLMDLRNPIHTRANKSKEDE